MLDIHAKMFFVASRINASSRPVRELDGTPAANSRINHMTDRVRLISPRKIS
ncbi:hypothetical protein ROE7235_02870 [Roseibaca ekhonensis]|jgi:hypothetical protein|uniref:Uncharacterized protein n=1 Tax=Roseinatronobacter ekhonensis TaxID=254356 RepID=A0A3B0MB79_9RHOB|nr:hypothetical protein [Roseibaca ekhonensis]SUZ33102.1 hypothetical protein ROE7235_02870 [Roseibaca ekhonensis]